MPPHNYTSITLPDRVYYWLVTEYQRLEWSGQLPPGVQSMPELFYTLLEYGIYQKNSMTRFVSQIKYVPKKFTETKLRIKNSKPLTIWPKFYPPNYC